MSIVLTHDCEGTNGAAVPSSGTEFWIQSTPDTAKAIFTTAWKHAGNTSIQLKNNVVPILSGKTGSKNSGSLYFQYYGRINSLPAGTGAFKGVYLASWNIYFEEGWYLQPNGNIGFGYNSPGGYTDDVIACGLTPGTEFRIEWNVTYAGGTSEIRLFLGANKNGSTPDFTASHMQNSLWSSGYHAWLIIGGYLESGGGAATARDINVDAVKADDTTWIGNGASPQTLNPAGISVPVGFGSPSISQNVNPGGIDVQVGVGTPDVVSTYYLNPPGISVPVGMGTIDVSTAYTIDPPGIPVTVDFGEPSISQVLDPEGIGVQVDLGTPDIRNVFTLNPPGISVPVQFGEPTIDQNVFPDGIDVQVDFCTPQVSIAHTLNVPGIDVQVVFGEPLVFTRPTWEIEVRRRLIAEFIERDPSEVVIEREQFEDNGSGGRKKKEDTALPPQVATVQISNNQLPERQTEDGEMVFPSGVVIGPWDMNIERGDEFLYGLDKSRYEVLFVHEDRSYRTKAEILYRRRDG